MTKNQLDAKPEIPSKLVQSEDLDLKAKENQTKDWQANVSNGYHYVIEQFQTKNHDKGNDKGNDENIRMMINFQVDKL